MKLFGALAVFCVVFAVCTIVVLAVLLNALVALGVALVISGVKKASDDYGAIPSMSLLDDGVLLGDIFERVASNSILERIIL